ncbi:MAG TPA: ATP-binding protein, partial [Chloroflexota bacterium]|nr:ATP-binding protein [Chloroflexota bacterium]
DWIEVNVSDTGVGIAREDQPRIFERLFRLDRGRGRDDGHSGLGLPIVREIVEAHGGVVGVESEPGRGSVFKFTLPVFRPDA